MTYLKSAAAIAAIAAVTLAFGATAASAAGAPATTATCIHAATQVQSALSSNSSADNVKAAKSEQKAGSYFCMSGMFAKGVDHYNQALTLLGQQTASASN